MSRARFFLIAEYDPSSPGPLPLSPADAHHAARVLRVEPGEELDVVTPSGQGHRVEVTDISPAGVFVRALEQLTSVYFPHVTLFQGVAKGEKMDTIVRQAVEVGVAGIVPVLTSRSIVRLDARKRAERGERWRRVAESASKQSRRERVVGVEDPIDLSAVLPRLRQYDRVIVLWEDYGGAALLSEVASESFATPDSALALFVGPEGGLSTDEVAELVAGGATVASLGPAIMRTETAAVVSVALTVAAAHQTRDRRGC